MQSSKLPPALQRICDLQNIFPRLHKDLLPQGAPYLERYQTKANMKTSVFLSVYAELLQQLIPVLQGRTAFPLELRRTLYLPNTVTSRKAPCFWPVSGVISMLF